MEDGVAYKIIPPVRYLREYTSRCQGNSEARVGVGGHSYIWIHPSVNYIHLGKSRDGVVLLRTFCCPRKEMFTGLYASWFPVPTSPSSIADAMSDDMPKPRL